MMIQMTVTVFNKFPRKHMTVLLGDLLAEVSRYDLNVKLETRNCIQLVMIIELK
jgi:hypothetical protein